MSHPSPFSGESTKVGKMVAEIPDCEDVLLDELVVESDGEEEEVINQVPTKKGKGAAAKKPKSSTSKSSSKLSSSKASSSKSKK